MKKGYQNLLYLLFISTLLVSCSKTEHHLDNTLTSLDDVAVGTAIDNYLIQEENINNPIAWLEQDSYEEVYTYMDSLVNVVRQTSEVSNNEDWCWKFRIYHQENVENAFVAPGGYMYVSTGLLHKIESEAELVAIIGHMMINIDQRIVSQKLADEFSQNFMLDYALGGNQDQTPELVHTIRMEAYALEDVQRIEEQVQQLLCTTNYDAQQFSTFLLGLTYDDEWYQLYPDYENREDDIHSGTAANACLGEMENRDVYLEIRGMLP